MTQAPQLRSRIVGHDDVDPSTLIANPSNWRRHPKEQADALDAVLEGVGWVGSVTVNRRSGLLVDGHLRVQRAISHGEQTVPVTYVDLSSEEERLVLATLDPIAALAQADEDLVARLFADGMGAGAEDERLAALLASLRADEPRVGLTDPDEVPPLPEEPVTKRGYLWILGTHILCGDATNAEDVARLMGGEKADCVFTDPPYGVGYDGGAKKRDKLDGDQLGTTIYADALPNLRFAAADHAALYLWYADAHAAAAAAAAAAAGYDISAQIIWVKNNAQFVTSAHYKGKHEPCFYAHRRGQTARWTGPNNEVTVWEADRANSNDIFVGGGTTIIACENIGRRAYCLEIEPRYVDVCVARWEAYSGRKAVLEGAPS